ncbi:hypothetical protein [Blastococcus sp. TF02A-35]|uniref:hypothetical protein n=1 Tax=Blastococcus sp. TF02A-35 TaxID=2559612 RepID=UPI001074362C|nr:hypothetical protein [Blastococcus sp. TF02A_35]TFV48157.1 hypothetical protein E4P43_14365 [Blastococcus sp. TF02A_35]
MFLVGMKRILGAGAAVTAALLTAVPATAQAAATSCINGTSTGHYQYIGGNGGAYINDNTAWRFRAQQMTQTGVFYVGVFSGDNATGFIAQRDNDPEATVGWVGWWSTGNIPSLANSEKVTNYGAGQNFYYDRSCTRV